MTSALTQSLVESSLDAPDQQLATLCKAAADGLRLRVLRLLRQDAMGVGELCEVLDVRQPALSHHLKLMSAAGLLSSQRDGNHIFYRRREVAREELFAPLLQALFIAADALPLDTTIEQRLITMQHKRETNSLEFFRDNAQRFREQQDLIAAPERYAAVVQRLVESIPPARRDLALEIGPGEGWLLPQLSKLFKAVIAVDNAPAMLNAARATCDTHEAENVEFVLGDTAHPRLRNSRADVVVINMVLHHTPDPRATMLDAAAALRPGGALLLTELCEHRQGWTRENCGDLWLGFDPQQISDWAESAGLEERTSSYLGQRNGFKLQLRLFTRQTRSTPATSSGGKTALNQTSPSPLY